ncbi:hypothetical protein [Brevundimonas aurifodinae]|uniref:Lipoprotein n=2 Tax=Brevundimonas TaxID=41275 RepID=A0ABV1NR68_9CAUL|nr:MAG: hypothetical protein B7Z42_02485 [Brevundimonas sp. 12-68-7]OYX35041.1 MAG: hypothetical protein B7Z01_03960 [Brevundimonas subvibrioides]
MASIRALSLIVAAALATSACALFPRGDATVRTAAMPGQLEPIHAAAITRDLAVFWVSSNGCTDKDDLTPIIDRAGDGSTITLRRIDEDTCDRPMADGVEIIWSFEELGLPPGSRVQVNNPYQLPPSI